MTGPTTTGSIDAKLTIDKSAWDRNKDEAKREAAELGALNPEIKVDANVGPALAKLAAVAKAERDLETAYMRSTIAQEKLDLVTKKHGDDSLQAASARLTLKRAVDAEADAEARLATRKGVTVVEQDKATASTERATNANRRHVSGLHVLLATAPLILAAAGPIAGAAVGMGAAFGIMAVSGVIAVKGIKDEMAKGTAVGNEYAAGLGSLKGNLDSLGNTAANRMLSSFNATVDDINTRMPALNEGIGDGAAALGKMGGTALRNVLDGLGAMKPLLQAGTVELSGFVGWLTNFSQANGFQSFVSYATTNLPSVTEMLQELVTLGGSILAAFAPLGPVVIGLISGLAEGLNGLPLPVLAGLVTSTLLLGPALRFAFSPAVAAQIGVVAAQIGLTGVMANLAVPVVGILTAVIAGLGIMAATSAMSTDTASTAVQEYRQQLEQTNGVIGEGIRQQAAKAVADSTGAGAAKTLGLATSDLTDYILGNADAQDKVNAALSKAAGASSDASKGITAYGSGARATTQEQADLQGAVKDVEDVLMSQTGALGEAKDGQERFNDAMGKGTAGSTAQADAIQRQATAYGVSVAAMQGAQKAQEDHKTSAEAATVAMQLEGNAAGLLKAAFDDLNGKSLGLEQAQTRAAAATNSVSQSFVQNGLAINGGTAAAVANQQALQNKVAADQAAAEAIAKSTGMTADGTAAYAESKAQLERNMAAQGLLTEEVQTYINKLYDVNNFKPKPVKLEVDNAAAAAKIQYIKDALAGLDGRVATSYVDTIQRNFTSSQSSGNSAKPGSIASAFAGGGEVPQYLATGGHPGTPRGTDTVPAWLTPEEFVVKRASAQSIGKPALDYMNKTGQLPPQPAQAASPGVVSLAAEDRALLRAVAARPVNVQVGATTIATANIEGRKKLRLPT